jgi:hypothetical protein
MSFPVLERFRKDPVQVASVTPIVSFGLEQHGDNTVIKSAAPGNELFAVRGQARIAALDFVEKSDALMMKVDLKNVEAKVTAEDCMPFYFLPWIGNAIARTTLRPRSQTTRAGVVKGLHQMAVNPKFRTDQNDIASAVLDPNDPDVFFTSAVNGCTVTVRGSREEPTVYHGNAVKLADAHGYKSPCELAGLRGDEVGANNLITIKVQDMQRMLAAFEVADPKADRLGGAHTPAAGKMVTQSEYQMLAYPTGEVAPSQRAAARQMIKTVAKDERVNKKTVRVASSLGTVFGIRRAGQWTFYYQKLVKFEFLHDVAPWNKKADWQKNPARPSTFRLVEFGEFWPGGTGILIP